MKKEKVLIVSHNSINKFDNMGRTIGNIFKDFSPDEICQLFFRKQDIDSDNCNRFYLIDEVSILKSIIKRNINSGKEINEKQYKFQKDKRQEDIYQYGRKKTGLIYLARNIMWTLGKWNTKDLDRWLKKNKPTCIFFFAGDYTFSFSIAIKLSKKLNIPLYIYFSDEYYRYSKKSGIFDKISKFFYRKKFKKAISLCTEFFCITESMRDYYSKIFNRNGKVIMNTTNIKALENKDNKDNYVISYIGNLGFDRWKSILDVADVITHINSKKIQFNLYSGENNLDIINKIRGHKAINYKGFINAKDIIEVMKDSDILLHIEDFSDTNIQKIKYSISTKIPDSLASGRLLLIYGPKGVACVDYVEKNNAGIVVHNKDDLKEKLQEIIEKQTNTKSMLERAQALVEKNHRNNIAYNLLHNIGGK